MASGGARARSGPAKDENALRRERDGAQWRVLPREGRAGDPPPWPMAEQSPREARLWELLWARPEAVGWEQDKVFEVEVAIHVRTIAEAEKPGAAANLRTLVIRQAEELGLNDSGRRRRMWRIAESPEPARKKSAAKKRRAGSRARLKVVAGE